MSESADSARKPRRRAVKLSDVDEERLRRGDTPTWLEPARLSEAPETRPASSAGLSPDERRLLEDVPPHWSPPGV